MVGGNSLVKYGGNVPERDETDKALPSNSSRKEIPSLRFLLRYAVYFLDYFGNELVNILGHVAVRHKVCGTLGAEKGVERQGKIEVNSYHNQACITLKNDELISVVKTEDGVIEKVEHKSLPIVGTIWHPEIGNPFKETDVNLMKSLFDRKDEG